MKPEMGENGRDGGPGGYAEKGLGAAGVLTRRPCGQGQSRLHSSLSPWASPVSTWGLFGKGTTLQLRITLFGGKR